ncbi:hypothetical protein C8A05DRAFT_20526 [Staphylotrichum tortipilum]|uniref:Uncharacterized protein n=1 Tax=Staphylotrichum tortipilum TaxID=2831512 RepID=A0AAN6RNE6_9PEZI|nr:hypothetical protein C8A05DRAFT_20526 [Staphylotrichum longicolle]
MEGGAPLILPNPGLPTDRGNKTNCKIAGEFFATWIASSGTRRGAGVNATASYLRLYFNLVGNNTVSDGVLVGWFVDKQNQARKDGSDAYAKFLNTTIQPVVSACGSSVCRSLGWTGNGDLAGIGVISSYCIEAFLVTLYMAVLLSKTLFRFKGRSWLVTRALMGTLADVVTGVFIFSLMVAIASLVFITNAYRDADLSVTKYDILMAIIVTGFSVAPATLLYGLFEPAKALTAVLRFALLLLWVLMIVVAIFGYITDPLKAASEAGTIGNAFETYCEVVSARDVQIVRILAVVVGGLGVLWGLYQVQIILRPLGWRPGPGWRAVMAVVAWLAMVGSLVWLMKIRGRSIWIAGDSDKSNDWSLGQIVALATWIPPFLNFCYILMFGVKEAHGARLPEGYGVTLSPGDDERGGLTTGQGMEETDTEAQWLGPGATYHGSLEELARLRSPEQ